MNIFSSSLHFLECYNHHLLNCCMIWELFFIFLPCCICLPDASFNSIVLIHLTNFVICYIIYSIFTFILFYFKIYYFHSYILYKLNNILPNPKTTYLEFLILAVLKLAIYLGRIDYQEYCISLSQILYFSLDIL